MSETARGVQVPPRIARLPRNRVGYPIPWFVAHLGDGSRDFRVAGGEQWVLAVKGRLCWVCGDRLGVNVAFTVGPMCAVNRISAEPPSHRDCAVYAARVCPFLSVPAMRRREGGKPVEDVVAAAGEMDGRNPGVTLVWVTRSFRPFRAPLGNKGWLIEMGEPDQTLWFTRGGPAGRAQVLAAFESGLPVLQAACARDDDPGASLADVDRRYRQALQLVPAA